MTTNITVADIRQLFPVSLRADTIGQLILGIAVYLILGIAFGLLMRLFSHVPIARIIAGILSALAELYVVIGIALLFLNYFRIL